MCMCMCVRVCLEFLCVRICLRSCVCVCACVCVCMCMCCVLCSHGDCLVAVFLAAVAFFAGLIAVAFYAGFFAVALFADFFAEFLAVCEMRGKERCKTVGRKGKTEMHVRKWRLVGNYKRFVNDLRCLWCTKTTHSLSPFLPPCLLSFIPPPSFPPCLLSFIPLSFPSSLSVCLPPSCTHLVSVYDIFGSFLCLPQMNAVIRNLANFVIDFVLEICIDPRGARQLSKRAHTHTQKHAYRNKHTHTNTQGFIDRFRF